MICAPLKQLVDWCDSQQVPMSPRDMIRLTCVDCHNAETCPAGVQAEGSEETENEPQA